MTGAAGGVSSAVAVRDATGDGVLGDVTGAAGLKAMPRVVFQVASRWLVSLALLTMMEPRVPYAVIVDGVAGGAGGECRCRNGCWGCRR